MPYKDLQTSRAYQRDYKRLKRAGECQTPSQTLLPADFRVQTAKDAGIGIRDPTFVGTLIDELSY